MVLSIGIFFSLMITGLPASLPQRDGQRPDRPRRDPRRRPQQVAGLPPVAVLFASLLGYNPIQSLLGPHGAPPACRRATLPT